MGYVNDIYVSKISKVQQKLNSVAERSGIKAPVFKNYLQEAAAGLSAIDEETPLLKSMPAVSDTAVAYKTASANADNYNEYIDLAASVYGLEPALIKAVIQTESSFRENAVSASGAMGLMQLKPDTANSLGVSNPFDPASNIMGGAAYLKKQLDKFGDLRLALAAYNDGPSRISDLNILNPDDANELKKLDESTRSYINNVFAYFNTFSNMA